MPRIYAVGQFVTLYVTFSIERIYLSAVSPPGEFNAVDHAKRFEKEGGASVSRPCWSASWGQLFWFGAGNVMSSWASCITTIYASSNWKRRWLKVVRMSRTGGSSGSFPKPISNALNQCDDVYASFRRPVPAVGRAFSQNTIAESLCEVQARNDWEQSPHETTALWIYLPLRTFASASSMR